MVAGRAVVEGVVAADGATDGAALVDESVETVVGAPVVDAASGGADVHAAISNEEEATAPSHLIK